MKNKYIIIFFLLFLFSGCTYDILESKPGESLNRIANLQFTISDSNINFNWELPSVYPDDILKPVSIVVSVTKISKTDRNHALYNPSTLNAGAFTLGNDPTSFTYEQYDSDFTFRFTFKVKAEVDDVSVNFSSLRYSEGVVIEI